MDIIHRIKSEISESYRIRQGFGLSPIRSNKELKALIGFCKEELSRKEQMRLNPKRREVFNTTIYLYENPGKEVTFCGEIFYEVYSFVNKCVEFYWN